MTAAYGRRYVLPERVTVALERIFSVPVGGVVVIERSLYARLHLGMAATTRPNRILLAITGEQFIAAPELVLHEYFHVLRQWGEGRLTRRGYLLESARRGYRDNAYEREAREFTAAALPPFCEYLASGHLTSYPRPVKQADMARS